MTALRPTAQVFDPLSKSPLPLRIPLCSQPNDPFYSLSDEELQEQLTLPLFFEGRFNPKMQYIPAINSYVSRTAYLLHLASCRRLHTDS